MTGRGGVKCRRPFHKQSGLGMQQPCFQKVRGRQILDMVLQEVVLNKQVFKDGDKMELSQKPRVQHATTFAAHDNALATYPVAKIPSMLPGPAGAWLPARPCSKRAQSARWTSVWRKLRKQNHSKHCVEPNRGHEERSLLFCQGLALLYRKPYSDLQQILLIQ